MRDNNNDYWADKLDRICAAFRVAPMEVPAPVLLYLDLDAGPLTDADIAWAKSVAAETMLGGDDA